MARPFCGSSSTTCGCTLTTASSTDGVIDLPLTGNGGPGAEYLITPRFDRDAFNAIRQIGGGLTGYIIPENVGSPDAPPLKLKLSGTWGVGALAGFGGISINGQPIYVDTAGNLRTEPDHTAVSGVLTANWLSGLTPSQTINAITDHTANTYTFNNPSPSRYMAFTGRFTTAVISTAALAGGSSWSHEVSVIFRDTATNTYSGGYSDPALPKARWCRVTSGNFAGYTVGGWFNFQQFATPTFVNASYGIKPGFGIDIEIDQRITWRAGVSAGLALTGSTSVYYFARTQYGY